MRPRDDTPGSPAATADGAPDEAPASALALAEAEKLLGAATARLTKALGLDVHACRRQDGGPAIAIVILDSPVAVLETHGTTMLDAVKRATAFLDRLSDGADAMRVRRMPPAARGHEVRALPELRPPTKARLVKIGQRT